MDSTRKLYNVLLDVTRNPEPSDAALRTALFAVSAYPDHGRYASVLVDSIVLRLETLLYKHPKKPDHLIKDIYHTARLLLNYVSRVSSF